MQENEATEFKKGLTQLKDGLISITAILNKHGAGELWFGVRDDGTPIGLEANEKTLRDISQAIAAHIEPKIYPAVSKEVLDGKVCIKVAFSGSEIPYFAYGRAYMRVADEDRQLSAKELENIILSKNHSALRWDNKPGEVNIADIDEGKVKKFVERAGLTWDTMPNVLEKLDVMRNGKLLNAAPLFFGKKPAAKLRCAVFASTTSATILDQHDYEGDILELIEAAQLYALKNIHIGMRLEGLYRVDVPEIAPPALREAIINAFCHRDYRDPEEVRVAVFKDRVEIRNPGKLFGGLTISKLRKGNVSIRRNPLIADMLKRIQMVEGWGRGLPLILANEPGVKFRELASLFIAAFARPSFTGGGKGETGPVEEPAAIKGSTKVPAGTTPKTTPKTTLKTTGETYNHLSEQEKIVLRLIMDTPTISQREMAAKLGLTEDGIRYHTRKLKVKGVLRRSGGTKGGRWEIVE